jgi:hypothetical protein
MPTPLTLNPSTVLAPPAVRCLIACPAMLHTGRQLPDCLLGGAAAVGWEVVAAARRFRTSYDIVRGRKEDCCKKSYGVNILFIGSDF